MLQTTLKSAVRDHGGVLMVLIDGIADFCNDPNDAKECFELVRKLHKLAVDHGCLIVSVIHENPGQGGGKTRGHLGSQLERKAETSLRLQKDPKTGVIEMWVERGRSCFIPRSAGIRLTWSEEAHMLVTLHAAAGDAPGAKVDKSTRLSREVEQVFADDERLAYGRFVEKLVSSSGLAESTAKARIPDYLALKLVTKHDDGSYQVVRPEPVE
jgi:RecA-family ATPase